MKEAWEFSRMTGVRLVFTQLSTNWVHDIIRWVPNQLPTDTAVIIGYSKRFGELPIIEWGDISTI